MHAISVYLLKKEEIRNEKIDSLFGDINLSKIKFTEMGKGILATTKVPKSFLIDKTYAKISTDYFGGIGEQSAKLFKNGQKVYDKDSRDYSNYANPINDVLKMMGVVSENGMDEFDTIGLSKYRENNDFNV